MKNSNRKFTKLFAAASLALSSSLLLADEYESGSFDGYESGSFIEDSVYETEPSLLTTNNEVEDTDFFITASEYAEERESLAAVEDEVDFFITGADRTILLNELVKVDEEEADFYITASDSAEDSALRQAEANKKSQGVFAGLF